MKALNIIAHVLVIVGGLNWGLVGLFDFNLVSALFGIDSWFTNVVYIVVGAAALYSIYTLKPLSTGTDVEHGHHGQQAHGHR